MTDVLRINDKLSIPMQEINVSAIRSSGAGGQNVNKVATAIHLRFDISGSESLAEAHKRRLLALEDGRVNSDGVIVIKAQGHRRQERNRQDALERLADFIRRGLARKKHRIATKPSAGARQSRLDDKRKRANIKKTRGVVKDD